MGRGSEPIHERNRSRIEGRHGNSSVCADNIGIFVEHGTEWRQGWIDVPLRRALRFYMATAR
jgi:hypothetical protein